MLQTPERVGRLASVLFFEVDHAAVVEVVFRAALVAAVERLRPLTAKDGSIAPEHHEAQDAKAFAYVLPHDLEVNRYTPGASGQGSFTWVQDGEASVLRVSGPFGAGGYEVHWTPDRLTVVSARGEVAADYQGPDAARRFLEQQLGWSLPAGNARWWLLGLPGPASPATETAGPDGLPVALVQDGWTVRYDEYRPAGTLALPRKLVLEGDAGRIRLVIDDWRLD
ncbi:MAG: outer membrane lipoprotein LolB [Gammaproteobacteria bacterium]|nr:outer membrane lipoprotein LolB [Gammaproteobacteria bacterium]